MTYRAHRSGWLVAAVLGFVVLAVEAEKGGRVVDIQIDESLPKTERLAWTAYGLGLAHWVEKNNIADSAPEGPFSPSFAAELSARDTQLQIWSELEDRPSFPYMDTMLQVRAAGFLDEYVWQFHFRPDWSGPPPEDDMKAFSEWSAKNMRDHAPRTGARVVFGPVSKK